MLPRWDCTAYLALPADCSNIWTAPAHAINMPGMNALFTRPIDATLMEEILLTRPFHFLTRNISALVKNDPNAITVQLLSRNRLAYHHGSQCILTVLLQLQRGKPLLKCSADRCFRDHRLCPESSRQYRHLMHNWVGSETSSFSEYFKEYMHVVVKAVEPRHYEGDEHGRKAEGYWINMAYHRFGEEWSKNKPWLVIDREFSLGFPQAPEKKSFYAAHAAPYFDIRRRLQTEDPEKWGKPSKRAPRHETGLLAIDQDGQLIAIELRRGSNTAGICWAPMAAAMHRDAIAEALPNISDSLITLIMQKISLGLLPEAAAQRIPQDGFTKVSAAVAVADPQPDDHPCWALLNESINYVNTIRPDQTTETARIFQQ